MLFSSNGKLIKEISDDSIKIVGTSIKVGDKGNIHVKIPFQIPFQNITI